MKGNIKAIYFADRLNPSSSLHYSFLSTLEDQLHIKSNIRNLGAFNTYYQLKFRPFSLLVVNYYFYHHQYGMRSLLSLVTLLGALTATATAQNQNAVRAMCIGAQTQGGYNVDIIYKNVADGSIDSLCDSFTREWRRHGGGSRNNPVNCFADRSKGEWGFGVSTDGPNFNLPEKIFMDAYEGGVDGTQIGGACIDIPNQLSSKRSTIMERRDLAKREINGDEPLEAGNFLKIFSGQTLNVQGIIPDFNAGLTDYGPLGETITDAARSFGGTMGSLGKNFALISTPPNFPFSTSRGRDVGFEAGMDMGINDQNLDIRGEDWFKIISALYFKGKGGFNSPRAWKVRLAQGTMIVGVISITFTFGG
ncbi:hypothetical protein CC78DRAFT_317012 [Lojkania enalia]|uniref:Uncharacterized protein n=1 Tax=Lojkania enalia TaxID=147567 RepID=A0A9P4N2C7_9PLEO|nr:hypothetical protein CC78DRAFT_317012 [Didymosphaeria enalia]